MNRKRCPWCGKVIDKKNDIVTWDDAMWSSSVPRMLHQANCSHCHYKYGQAPFLSFNLKIDIIVIILLIIGFAVQSVFLLVVAFLPMFLNVWTPYSKLDDKGKIPEINYDLFCAFDIIEKYDKFMPYELYFLEDCFDDFAPFVLAAPIQIQCVSQKDVTIFGEFLYMNERNYDYIEKDTCLLYDTDMNLIAKIKFRER